MLTSFIRGGAGRCETNASEVRRRCGGRGAKVVGGAAGYDSQGMAIWKARAERRSSEVCGMARRVSGAGTQAW